jgi:hypothetical protein
MRLKQDQAMLTLAFSMVAHIRAFFRPRHQFALEAASVRRQLAVLKRNLN